MTVRVAAYNFSRGLSVLLHPLLMPTYVYLMISSFSMHPATRIAQVRLSLTLLFLITTFLIPLMVVLILKTVGLIRSLEMHGRSERTLPLLLTAIIYYFSFRYIQRFGLPAEYSLMLLGATSMILMAMFLNLRWKISLHMMGIGGVAGILHGMAGHFPDVVFISTVAVIAMAGLLGSSRLFAGSHKPAEIYSGFISGYLLFLILFTTIHG
jgi:hypothetical protein